MKACCRCKEELPLSAYSKNKRTVDGYKHTCKGCISSDYYKNIEAVKKKQKDNYLRNKAQYIERARKWKKLNPDKVELSGKKEKLKAEYGLSWETYTGMYQAQDGTCAICQCSLSLHASHSDHPSACVDHCHTTKKVRGLLCYKCNLLLGHAKDDVSILEAAKEYLLFYGKS